MHVCLCIQREGISKHDILASKACARCLMLGVKSYKNQEKLLNLTESQHWSDLLDLMLSRELVKYRPHL